MPDPTPVQHVTREALEYLKGNPTYPSPVHERIRGTVCHTQLDDFRQDELFMLTDAWVFVHSGDRAPVLLPTCRKCYSALVEALETYWSTKQPYV